MGLRANAETGTWGVLRDEGSMVDIPPPLSEDFVSDDEEDVIIGRSSDDHRRGLPVSSREE